jgi:hypothetical protein
MNGLQVLEMTGKKDDKKSERSSQISFKLAAEDKRSFDVIVSGDGEDLTGVLRHMVKDYISRHRKGLDVGVDARKRADLVEHIIQQLSEWAIRNKAIENNITGLELMLRLRKGALLGLMNEEPV